MIKIRKEFFDYIEDDIIREHCLSDFNELEFCISNQLFKSAIVLSGGLIEAILYYFISSRDEYKSRIKNFEKRNVALNDLLTWSREFGIIDESLYKMADQIRNFRNTIHPNVCIRKNLEINRNVVLISYNVLLEIIRVTFNYFGNEKSDENEKIVWKIIDKYFGRPPSKSEIFIYKSIINKYGEKKGSLIIKRSIEGVEKIAE